MNRIDAKQSRWVSTEESLSVILEKGCNVLESKCFIIIVIIALVWSSVSFVHSIQYDIDNNNCLHQSKAIVKWCNTYGVPAELISGYHSNVYGDVIERHAWVRFFGWLDFESTLWFFLPNSYTWTVETG